MATYTGQDKRLKYLFENGGGGGGGTNVEANPQGTPTDFLSTIKIGNNIFDVGKIGDIYSNTERQVGVWINGKPIYQRTITATANVNINNYSWTDISNAIDNPLSNVETLIGAILHNAVPNDSQILRFYCDSGVLNCASYTSSGVFYSGLVFTLLYTKTTDTAGSGIWTPQGSYAHHYSTSEQIIGTWLGKTLYERVFDLGSDIGVPHDNFVNTSINASNMQTLVYAKGIFSTGETVYNLMANKGNGVVRLQSDRYNGGANVRYLILEYTKITD